MPSWDGPLFAAATLLILAAVPKIRYPDDTARALRSTGLPGSNLLVRLLAVIEILIGGYALLIGDRASAGLVAVSYLGFTGFVLLARSRDGVVSSCGCFGQRDTPPTRSHVVVTALLAAGAVGAVIAPAGSVLDLVDRPGQGVALVLLSGICVGLAYLALAVLPTLTLATEKP
ncbi:MAG TPA: MauE/DoxX family redox-associated membrane protein [Frankiaceae bacterium]|nr:MauE/DoxX family redox-associated membrane protein [Frankiaceae bacterium]